LITDSNNSQKIDVNDIGLLLLGSEEFPFLKIGLTRPVLVMRTKFDDNTNNDTKLQKMLHNIMTTITEKTKV